MENRPLVKLHPGLEYRIFLILTGKDINDVISIPLKLLSVHSFPNAKTKMASDWFVKLSEVDIKSVSKEQENVKTKKKT